MAHLDKAQLNFVVNPPMEGTLDAPSELESKQTKLSPLQILMMRALGTTSPSQQAKTVRNPLSNTWPPLGPVMPPPSSLSTELQTGAHAFSASLNRLFHPTRFTSMNPDQLLAEFLKLQIEDPNNSVETHQDLQQAMSELRQLAIDEAQARIARAEEMRKEAEAYASFASIFGFLLTFITLALSFVTAGLSLGMQVAATAAQTAAQTAATQAAQKAAQEVARETIKHVAQQAAEQSARAAQQAAQSTVRTLHETINPFKNNSKLFGQVAKGMVHAKAAEKTADARQQQLMAERMRQMAELFQNQLEEEGELIEMLITSKNQAVDSVIRMLNAGFISRQKILAAGMAR